MKRRALVRLQSLLGDEQSKEFALRHLHGREPIHVTGVAVAVGLGVPLDGQAQLVAHEGDIPVDCLRARFQSIREDRRVRQAIGVA